MREKLVAVIGAGVCDAVVATAAERVGASLAEANFGIVCGGLGGVMEAACRGAKGAGGWTVGILPGARASDANGWVDIAIPTGLGEARNAIVVRAAAGVIAVGGEYGTLAEIAFALKFRLPVVGLDTWQLQRRGADDAGILRATDPVMAVKLLLDAISKIDELPQSN
jgi:uncharacterized protein (TIGR00725 family)